MRCSSVCGAPLSLNTVRLWVPEVSTGTHTTLRGMTRTFGGHYEISLHNGRCDSEYKRNDE